MLAITSARGRRPRRAAVLLAALLLVAALTSCTDTAAQLPPAPPAVVEKIWTTTGIDPISEVDRVGGVAVVYGTVPGGVMIYVLDPANGEQLWSNPALPLWSRSADDDGYRRLDDSVAYFRPTGTDRVSQLVLADPLTGRDLVVSAARYWESAPAVCDDDPSWVCLYSAAQRPDGGWRLLDFRVDRLTGRTEPAETGLGTPGGGYPMPVADLYFDSSDDDASDDRTLTFGRVVDGAASWTTPSSKIFGPEMPFAEYVSFSDPRNLDFIVMSAVGRGTETGLAGAPGRPEVRGTLLDLARDLSTAGLGLADGDTRWTAPGSILGCGNSQALGWDRSASGAADAFLCRYTGTAVRDRTAPAGSELLTTDLTVTLQRIDPATGAARWSATLGDAKSLALDPSGQQSAMLDDNHLFVPNSAGGQVVNLRTGQTRPPSGEDIFWCEVEGTFQEPVPHYEQSARVTTGDRGGQVRPCRADGSPAPLPTSWIPLRIGASFSDDPRVDQVRIGDLRVVAIDGGVSGFLIPRPADQDASDPPGADPASPDPATVDDPAADRSNTSASGASTLPAAGTSADGTSTLPVPTRPAVPIVAAIEQAWATEGFEATTTPVMVTGTAVLYGAVGTDLFLIGLDPATGAERWRKQATAAAFAPGTKVEVRQIDELIAYLRPVDDPYLARIVMVDPATGTDTMATQPLRWFEFPEICSDDDAFLCASVQVADGDGGFQATAMRVDRMTGAVTVAPDGAVGPSDGDSVPGTTVLWNDVVKIEDAPVETLGIVDEGALLWSAPLTDLLGPGATLDALRYQEENGDRPVLVLTAVTGWQQGETGYPALDLGANLRTVGIDRRTGAVLWTEPGTSMQCRDNLPSSWTMSTPGSDDPALRCRYSGRLDSIPAGRNYGLTAPTELSVALERVDLQTGKALWSVPLGAERHLAVDGHGLRIPLLDNHLLLVSGQVVDVDTGSARSPLPGESFWCPAAPTFKVAHAWYGRVGTVDPNRRVEGKTFLCDSTGSPITGPPTAVPWAVSNGTADGLRLVATPNGVVAYRVPL
jgi:hypothetical protein